MFHVYSRHHRVFESRKRKGIIHLEHNHLDSEHRGYRAHWFESMVIAVMFLSLSHSLVKFMVSPFRIYRSFIKTNLGNTSRRTKVERVLAILVESGALYCFFWVRDFSRTP